MIIYHPAYDFNHCVFRFITMLSDIEGNQTEWETMQILDFYYVFPHLLAKIRLPRNPIAPKKYLASIPQPYETLPDPRRLMFELRTLHQEAGRALVAKGILDKDLFLRNNVRMYPERIPDDLYISINNNEKRKTSWYRLIVKFLAAYPINGKDGLKARTQLMEYRYDTN